MPTSRFSTMSVRPTPCAPPSSLSLVSSSTAPSTFPLMADGHALFKVNGDVLWLVGRLLGSHGQVVHLLFRLGPRVLQDAPFVAHVPDVPVAAVDRLARGHRHVVGLGIGQRVLARADVPLAPGGDDLEQGVQRLDGQLKAHLVVALAGAAMRDRFRSFLLGDLDHVLGRDGPRKRGAQQVDVLIDRARLHGGKGILGEKLLPQVHDVGLAGAAGQGLLLQPLQLLVSLPQVRGKGDHLAAIVLFQPGHDARGIQSARIRQHHLLDICFHFTSLPRFRSVVRLARKSKARW